MKNGSFEASAWVMQPHNVSNWRPNSQRQNITNMLNGVNNNMSNPHPSQYLVPGWTGDGLLSKHSVAIKKTINALVIDGIEQLKNTGNFNRSLKDAIFDEWLCYLKEYAPTLEHADNCKMFWQYAQGTCDRFDNQLAMAQTHHYSHLLRPVATQSYKKELSNFISIYCFRTVVIYLQKIRFIIQLSEQTKFPLGTEQLFSPNAVISKLFRLGSDNDFVCEALESNKYSWYRPRESMLSHLNKILTELKNISYPELIKVFSSHHSTNQQLQAQQNDYAHSLSHRAFGNFLQTLLSTYPQWINQGPLKKYPKEGEYLSNKKTPQTLATKIVGDNLSEMAMAHFLGQEQLLQGPSFQISAPEISGDCFLGRDFLRIYHELHFLSLLIQLAGRQKFDPMSLISKVMQEKYSAQQAVPNGQINLFQREAKHDSRSKYFDRICLHISELPKTNSYHHLFLAINRESESLRSNGNLYVLTNQNLFVPSQSDKLEQLLQNVKLESYFNFEQLKGKGQIPNYLYIFSKRSPFTRPIPQATVVAQKEPCFAFRASGELKMFVNFKDWVAELQHFLQVKDPINLPYYQKELPCGAFFDYHQDTMIDGKILQSLCHDKNRITHPNFLKILTKSCSQLDLFFQIEAMEQEDQKYSKRLASDFLGVTYFSERNFPLTLIVNFENPDKIFLELIPSNSYHAKKEQYGTAYYYYFGLIPKSSSLNLNAFREFISCDLGQQVIQIALSHSSLTKNKIRAALKALLIPNFLLSSEPMLEETTLALRSLNLPSDELLKIHPQKIELIYQETFNLIERNIQRYPNQLIEMLSLFKMQLLKTLANLDEDQNSMIYNNPIFLEGLKYQNLKSLFPNNREAYLEFFVSHSSQLHTQLDECKIIEQEEISHLVLWSNGKIIVKIHTEKNLALFLKFVLQHAKSKSIAQILPNLKIPSSAYLHESIQQFSQMQKTLQSLTTRVEELIPRILQTNIFLKENYCE